MVLRDLVIKGSTAHFTAAEEIYEDNIGIGTGYAKTYICRLRPKQRVITRNLILGLSKDKIIIISTHIVSDIETIAFISRKA